MISSIFAMLPNGSIGHKNSLPWKGQKYKEIAIWNILKMLPKEKVL